MLNSTLRGSNERKPAEDIAKSMRKRLPPGYDPRVTLRNHFEG